MDVNQTIVKVLEDFGVQYVFGGSGQVNASMLLALRDSKKLRQSLSVTNRLLRLWPVDIPCSIQII